MKSWVFIIPITVIFTACSNKESNQELDAHADTEKASYDTTAIDSFSQGATNVDIAEQIRKSSFAYQDSLKQLAEKQKEEAEAKLLAEEKNKSDKEAKKAEDIKKINSTEKPTAETAPPKPESPTEPVN